MKIGGEGDRLEYGELFPTGPSILRPLAHPYFRTQFAVYFVKIGGDRGIEADEGLRPSSILIFLLANVFDPNMGFWPDEAMPISASKHRICSNNSKWDFSHFGSIIGNESEFNWKSGEKGGRRRINLDEDEKELGLLRIPIHPIESASGLLLIGTWKKEKWMMQIIWNTVKRSPVYS
jgi:hypothetical protein